MQVVYCGAKKNSSPEKKYEKKQPPGASAKSNESGVHMEAVNLGGKKSL